MVKKGVILIAIMLMAIACILCASCEKSDPPVVQDTARGPSDPFEDPVDVESSENIESSEDDTEAETESPTADQTNAETSHPDDEPTAEHVHSWGEWSVLAEAGCNSIGERVRKCSSCTDEEREELSPLGHNTVFHAGKDATCTDAGYYKYETCTRCEYTSYGDIAPLGHDLVKHDGVSATCTETGCGAYETCTRCEHTTYSEIPALGHAVTNNDGKAPTCTESGFSAYGICSRCGYATESTTLPSLGHDLIKHDGKAPTCTEKGYGAYETCTRCEHTTYSEIAPLGHDIVSHEGKAATCTESGWVAYVTCKNCDHSTYSSIPKLSHNIVRHAAKAPTCTEYGWEAYESCDGCGYTTYKQLSPRHDLIFVQAKAPTCTEKGWSAYERCRLCDYSDYSEKAPLGHDEVAHDKKDPTCSNIGWDAYVTCTRCDHSTYVERPKLEHNFVAQFCTICGAFELDVSWYDDSKRSFTITTLDQLKGLAYLVNSGKTFENKTVLLGNDISVNGEEWTPIGAERAFLGSFDGQGHTISNYKITDPKYTYNGLFGRVEGYGEIRNLNVKSSSINITTVTNMSGTVYVGGIAAKGYGFVSCTSDVDITFSSTGFSVEGGAYVGGIVGYALNGYLQSSSSSGSVRVVITGKGNWANTIYVGGAVGYISNVYESIADGVVYAESYMHEIYCGGLVGQVTSGVYQSSASGKVTSKGRRGVYTGGLVGYTTGGKLSESHATGDVSGSSDNNTAYVGGLVGYYYSYMPVDINKCTASGDVYAYGKDSVYVGGLYGSCTGAGGEPSGCTSTGTASGESPSGKIYKS